MTEVVAPLAGRLVPLTAVPDPVFAGYLLGAGVAIEPLTPDDGADVTVVAPVAGTVAKLHPHAAVVLTDGGVGVLVHVGIDTVQLAGAGFTAHSREGATVAVGEPLISFSPTLIRERGMSVICPVVVLDCASHAVPTPSEREVAAGAPLFSIPETG